MDSSYSSTTQSLAGSDGTPQESCGHTSGVVRYCFRRGAEAAREAADDDDRREYLEIAEARRGRDLLLDMAVALITRGIPVFPLEVRSKKPLMRGWQQLATTDPLVLQWWIYGQRRNIGVPTGRASGWVVVDPDGDIGRASWAAWQEERGTAPSTLTSITGREDVGHHHIFSITLDEIGDQWLSAGNNLLGDKVDVKADGGYIVVPPSIHPSGKAYCWEDFDVEPAPLPQSILDMLVNRGKRKRTSTRALKAPRSIDPNGPEPPERHRSTPWGRGALGGVGGELASAREGTRDNTAAFAYWRVGRLAASRQIDWVEGIEQLEEALEVNGLGAEGVKWHSFFAGYEEGLAEPVGPPLPSVSVEPVVDEGQLSQLLERLSNYISTNWDRKPKRRTFHPPTPSGPTPVTGYNRGGPFAEIVKKRGQPCRTQRHIIAKSASKGIYDMKVPCSVRACTICATRRLVDITAYIQKEVRLRPGGVFYRADLSERQWDSRRRSLASDRHDVDFIKVPTTSGYTVLAYAIEYTPPAMEPLDGWAAFLDALAAVWTAMPSGRENGAQIRYSRRWRAVENLYGDRSTRIGMTFQPDDVHDIIEQHGGRVIQGEKVNRWELPEGVAPEQIIAEHNENRRG